MRRKKAPRPQASPKLDPETVRPLSVRVPVAVKLTGISRSGMFLLIRDGEVESVKLGKARLVMVSSLELLLQRVREGYVPACYGTPNRTDAAAGKAD